MYCIMTREYQERNDIRSPYNLMPTLNTFRCRWYGFR